MSQDEPRSSCGRPIQVRAQVLELQNAEDKSKLTDLSQLLGYGSPNRLGTSGFAMRFKNWEGFTLPEERRQTN